MKKEISRRSFVRSTVFGSAGVMVIPHLTGCSANSRLNIAVIGVGGRGEKNWEACLEENIVALCDVDDAMAAKGFSSFPDALDWDLWLGQAEKRPYNQCYHPRLWRGWYDFGNGLIGDWACHTLDAPFWALDPGIPCVAEAEFRTPSPEGFIPDKLIVRMEFPVRPSKNLLTLKWYEGGLKPDIRPEWHIGELPGSGMIMVGDKRCLITGARPENIGLLTSDKEKEELIPELPERTIPRVDGGPQQEWIRAIKGKGPGPGSNFDYAADLTEMILLGALAQRSDTRIEYDAGNMKVINHSDFDQYIKEPVHRGWEYGKEVW